MQYRDELTFSMEIHKAATETFMNEAKSLKAEFEKLRDASTSTQAILKTIPVWEFFPYEINEMEP